MKVNDIIYEGRPGFGRGHPGFGQKTFARRHYEYMANQASKIDDAHARDYVINWLADLFLMDNPNFQAERFKDVAERRRGGQANPPKMQARHFHLFAEEVCTIRDPHIREFLRDWLADVIGSTNELFRRDKWEQFCNISASQHRRSYTGAKRQERRRELNLPDEDEETP